jgi:hypothetical protein
VHIGMYAHMNVCMLLTRMDKIHTYIHTYICTYTRSAVEVWSAVGKTSKDTATIIYTHIHTYIHSYVHIPAVRWKYGPLLGKPAKTATIVRYKKAYPTHTSTNA